MLSKLIRAIRGGNHDIDGTQQRGVETERWITKECIRKMRCGTTGQSTPNWRHRWRHNITGYWEQKPLEPKSGRKTNLSTKQLYSSSSKTRSNQANNPKCKNTTTLTLSPNTVYKCIFFFLNLPGDGKEENSSSVPNY